MLARMLDLELDLLEDDSGGLLGRVGSLALNWDLENGFQTNIYQTKRQTWIEHFC